MTTTCTYLQQLTQVSDVAHGPLVYIYIYNKPGNIQKEQCRQNCKPRANGS